MSFQKGYVPHNKGKGKNISNEEKRKKRLDYERKYRKINREMINKYYRELYAKKTEMMKKYKKGWRNKHPQYTKNYYNKNKDVLLKKSREYVHKTS